MVVQRHTQDKQIMFDGYGGMFVAGCKCCPGPRAVVTVPYLPDMPGARLVSYQLPDGLVYRVGQSCGH